jgi:prolyl oligopeptidase
MHCISLCLLLLQLLAGDVTEAHPEGGARRYPAAARLEEQERLHGTMFKDPYRWLESSDSPQTRAWIRAQDELLKSYLSTAPRSNFLEQRLRTLTNTDLYSAPRILNPPLIGAGDRQFFVKIAAGDSSPILYVRENDQTRAILDPREKFRDRDLELVSFTPSPDGRYVVCGLSRGQSRSLTIHVLAVDSGEELTSIVGGHFLGGVVSWKPNSSGFFYTMFDREDLSKADSGLKSPRIMFHPLRGADTVIYGRNDRPTWLFTHNVTGDGRYLVIEIRDGSARNSQVVVKDLEDLDEQRKPQMLIPEADADYTFLGGKGDKLWFYTDKAAPAGRIIAISVSQPDRQNWQDVVREVKESIAGRSSVGGNAIGMFFGRLVLMYLKEGQPLLRIFESDGTLVKEVQLPNGGSIWGGFSGNSKDQFVYYQYLGLTDPSTIYRLDVVTGKTDIVLRSPASFNPDDYKVERVWFKGKDGTSIPMFLAYKSALRRTGRNPTWLYGYGAFGWVSFVWYQPHIVAWLDMGGVFAIPALRGGGEFGEEWHVAGIKDKRQNAVDDYIYAAKWLTHKKYTSARVLVANGGSASAAAVAAAAVQQEPKLFSAVIIDRPILDLLRFDKFPAGAYWKSEFGSPSDPKEFKALYSYSPYHNFKRGTCYPPTLVMSGDRDQVASPAHAYKFTAEMQWAQGCDNPVLLKVMWGAGHNFGTSPEQTVDSWADALSFLVQVMNLEVKP